MSQNMFETVIIAMNVANLAFLDIVASLLWVSQDCRTCQLGANKFSKRNEFFNLNLWEPFESNNVV